MRIPRKILFVGVPVLLGGALATAVGAAAAGPTARPAAAAASALPLVATTPTPTPEIETPGTEKPEAGETPEAASANEPAGGGHSDEAPGSTTESNVDHQFEGSE